MSDDRGLADGFGETMIPTFLPRILEPNPGACHRWSLRSILPDTGVERVRTGTRVVSVRYGCFRFRHGGFQPPFLWINGARS